MASDFLAYYDHSYIIERDYLSANLLNSLHLFLLQNGVKKILEVGVGSGKCMKSLQKLGFLVKGIDISPAAAKIAGVQVASATDIPYKNKSFDCIIGISIIEHLNQNDGIRFIKEAKRVLKNNGVIFLVTPNFSSPLRYFQGKNWFGFSDKSHLFFYTPKTLKKLLIDLNFNTIKCTFKTTVSALDWQLPSFIKKSPVIIRRLINYILISSNIALFRDSFWISAKKTHENRNFD